MAVAAVLVAATASAVPATAKATPALPTLKGVDVFAGSSSGTMLLRLSRPAVIHVNDLTISGRGRFYGLVLEQDAEIPHAVVTYVLGRYCHRPGCAGPTPWGDGTQVTGDGPQESMPAGVYRVYLIADHAPVRVTMRLRGLSGTGTFRPRLPVRSTIVTPTPTQAEPASGPLLFAAGSTRNNIGRRGAYVVQLAWKDEPLPHEWTAWTVSRYPGHAQSGPTPAYQQGAGGNLSVQPIVGGNIASGRTRTVVAGVCAPYYISSLYTLDGFVRNDGKPLGQFSVGVSGNTAGAVYDAHYSVLWFDRQ